MSSAVRTRMELAACYIGLAAVLAIAGYFGPPKRPSPSQPLKRLPNGIAMPWLFLIAQGKLKHLAGKPRDSGMLDGTGENALLRTDDRYCRP